MNGMESTEAFEEVLLSYTDMCCAVAFALTRDPDQAQNLAHDVLLWAWRLRDDQDAGTPIKMKLLGKLRERFLSDYYATRQAALWPT